MASNVSTGVSLHWKGPWAHAYHSSVSYTEGINVLYSTNTIHISSAILLINLPAYILPQRLSAITSLEIIWSVETDVCKNKNLPRDKDLKAILLILDNHFPSLKRLNLALKLGLSKGGETEFGHIFATLDDFFIRHVSDRMQEPFAVSISYAAYVELRREIIRSQGHEGDTFHWQIWRSFDGEYVLPQKPWTGAYLENTPRARCNNGYWIYSGEISTYMGGGRS